MIEFSNPSRLNEDHIVERPFNENHKNNFFQGGLNFGKGRPENLG